MLVGSLRQTLENIFCLLATSMKEDCLMSRPVTLLACTARRMQSSKSCVRYISAASCIALRALVWKRRPWIPLLDASWVAISRTTLPNGRHGIRRLVDLWYFRISIKALVPGLYRCFLFSAPPGDGSVRRR